MIDKAGGVSAEAVRKATGRNWDEWFALLDAENASALSHAQIAVMAGEKFGASDWWSQMVTVAYEQARGLRGRYEKADGFTASRSKTIGVPVALLFAAWVQPDQRAKWLPDARLSVRSATEAKSLRLLWGTDSSTVNVNFTTKGDSRSQVAVEHARLPNAAAGDAMREYWSAALARLKTMLEAPSTVL